MTTEEFAEWLGDPMVTTGANLFASGPYYSSAVELKYRNKSILATATSGGTYLYAISIIGEAGLYEGKKFTFSLDGVAASSGTTPQIALYWHDDNGFDYAGATLTEAGSVSFTINANTNNRAYLAAYVYVTTNASVTAGAVVQYFGVMLELGNVRHE